MEVPPFSALSLDPSHPPHSAWCVWGRDDQLGTLNHLTPEVVVAAARDEIRTGIRIGLNWPLQQMSQPPPFRKVLDHRIHKIAENMHDDSVQFNTQTSSQWDGFRHCGYDSGLFYNGVTGDEILKQRTERIGIHGISHSHGYGIVGRGVLVDFASYAAKHSISFDPMARSTISLSTVKQILKDTGVKIRAGDVLLLRTGFIQGYNTADPERLAHMMAADVLCYPGVDNSREYAEWLWDSRIAAICADSPGFEAMPPKGFFLHPVLLAGFGMPIGELFDMESLAQHCSTAQRWTFFFTSEPLNITGGVASPPNALAIF